MERSRWWTGPSRCRPAPAAPFSARGFCRGQDEGTPGRALRQPSRKPGLASPVAPLNVRPGGRRRRRWRGGDHLRSGLSSSGAVDDEGNRPRTAQPRTAMAPCAPAPPPRAVMSRWRRQVSWLAGHGPVRPPSRFPSGFSGRGLSAHSCGGSHGFIPCSLWWLRRLADGATPARWTQHNGRRPPAEGRAGGRNRSGACCWIQPSCRANSAMVRSRARAAESAS